MTELAGAQLATMRELAEGLLRFESTDGEEGPAQRWFRDRLEALGFETYEWEPNPDVLEAHPSFPPLEELDLEDRPSVAGVLELGDPDAGPTLVLNGHVDVVPVERDHWSTEPFEPSWDGETLTARGAVDMKSQVAACTAAALSVAADPGGLDGRLVVECVAGEERGGLGAATAAAANPYPFERDAAIVAEPTDGRLVTATEGAAMVRLAVTGRSAHAARRWQGVDAVEKFQGLRAAILELEAERAERVTHPGYDRFDVPWPVVIGRVEAGNWASNVPGHLSAEARLGVAPGETVDGVIAEYADRVATAAADDEWLAAHPPTLERYDVQFEPAETDADEPVVEALRDAMGAAGYEDTDPVGETYGADSRHFVAAGIPAVVFGPGRIEEAHFPDESVHWPAVERAAGVLADASRRFLSAGQAGG
ncbi:MAG: M20/M25/M40 family metallo-hydrolase [Halobacteriales archaeon]|nr:M20/M25/M40 family metallo-hydrolase [Halobacteriales archaeon]